MDANPKQVERAAAAVQSCCKKAATAIASWDTARGELCGLLEALQGHTSACIGECGVVDGVDAAWGHLASLPGCIDGVRASCLNTIDDLVRATRPTLDAMMESSAALLDCAESAQTHYAPVSASPLLHHVHTVTGVPISDHLSALSAAHTLRLEYLALRGLCSFPQDLHSLAQAVDTALDEAQACRAVDWDALLPIYPT